MKYTLEIIVAAILVLFVATFFWTIASNPDAEFGGADGVGSAAVAEMTNTPEEEIAPLIPQWEPPSGEIEAGIFALQSAFGGIILGLCFGFLLGQKRNQA